MVDSEKNKVLAAVKRTGGQFYGLITKLRLALSTFISGLKLGFNSLKMTSITPYS